MEPRPSPPRPSRLPLLALALLAGACEVSLPWSTAPRAAPQGGSGLLIITPARLELRAWLQGPAPEAWLAFSEVPADVELQVVAGAALAIVADATPPGGGRGVLLRATSPDLLGAGDHLGTVRVAASRGGSPLQGSPFTVPYLVRVGPAALAPLPADVTFQQLPTGPIPSPVVLPIEGAPDAGPWTVAVSYGGPVVGDGWLRAVGDGQVPGSLTLTVVDAPNQFGGFPQAVATVTRAGQVRQVRVARYFTGPKLIFSTEPLSRTAVAGQPATVVFSIQVDTEAGVPTRVRTLVRNLAGPDGAFNGWLNCVPSYRDVPAVLACNVFTVPRLPGRYTGTVVVEQELGPAGEVPVVLEDVPDTLQVSSGDPGFTLTQQEAAESLRLDLTVTAAYGPVGWTAASEVPWLEVSPASGTAAPGAPAVVTVTLRPAALLGLDPLPSGGWVGVTSLEDGQVRWTWLRLTDALPRLQVVGPLLDVEGQQGEVVLVGQRLSPAPLVSFGGVPAASVRSVSFSEARAVPPVLPAGPVEVTLPSVSGLAFGRATYALTGATTLTPSSAAAPGRKARLAWDDATQTLWVVNRGGEALERWRPADGWAHQALAVPGLVDATHTAARDRVVVLAGGSVFQVDPTTLSVATTPPPVAASEGSERLAALLSGQEVIGRRTPGTNPASELVSVYYSTDGWLSGGWVLRGDRVAASRSGFVAALATDLAGFPEALTIWPGLLPVATPTPWAGRFLADEVAVDRHGDAILLLRVDPAAGGDSVLLDGTLTPRPGKLPPTIEAAVLTQAGDRAVCFDRADGAVKLFDLLSPPDAATGLFLQLGAPLTPDQPPGDAVTLALSGDDRLLFLGGDLALAVLPLP